MKLGYFVRPDPKFLIYRTIDLAELTPSLILPPLLHLAHLLFSALEYRLVTV